MKEKSKRWRKAILWIVLLTILYGWNKPETYPILAVIYLIFLVFNQYYCYLEDQEEEKKRLGKNFQKDKFFQQYRKEKSSLFRLELLMIGILLLLIQFGIKK